ncbi:MAG TPA: DUF2269 family protein, partial [Legionellaceae bacterium]|nr:DUF2269 family protein [Legionellaceae bacterium]
VYLQVKIRNITVYAATNHTPLPESYYSCFKLWFILGIPAFFSLLLVFYFMVMKSLSISIHSPTN